MAAVDANALAADEELVAGWFASLPASADNPQYVREQNLSPANSPGEPVIPNFDFD